MANYKKYYKYKELNEKLSASLKNEFYYEAIFIEFAIIEDRTSSMLRHAKYHQDTYEQKLNDKLKLISNSPKFDNEYVKKHITEDLIKDIHNWKNKRNKLIHNLAETEYSNEYIKNTAIEGDKLIKKLCGKSSLVNDYFDKHIKSIL